MTPEEIKAPFTEDTMINLAAQALGVEADRLRELAEADKDGRCVVLPCRKGERWKGEDGRAVVVTGVSNFADGDRKYFEVYFDYENAASRDDADTDCAGNWEWFKRHFTREEAERALQEMEGKKDG